MSVLESSSTAARSAGGRCSSRRSASASSRVAQRFHPRAHLLEHRHRSEPGDPLPVALHLAGDQLLGRRQLGAPALEIRRHHRLQVVEIVQEHVARARRPPDRRRAAARCRECRADGRRARRARDARARRTRSVAARPSSTRARRRRRALPTIRRSASRPRRTAPRAPPRARTCGWRRSRRARPDRVRHSSASSAISPAPSTIARLPASDPKICFASCTAAELTDAAPRATDVSLRTRPATEQRRLEEAIEHRPGMRAARFPRVAHLSVDLRLAEHHRIETAGDAEEMRRRFPVAAHIAVRRRVGAEPRGERATTRRAPRPRRLRRDRSPCDCTSRAARLRARPAALQHRVERVADLGRAIRDPLANVERRAAMVDADDGQRHSAILA